MTERLTVKLADVELKARSESLARAVAERDRMENARKDVVKEMKENIDVKDAEIRELARTVESGQEYREVDVREERNDKVGTVETFRMDTGELVRTRPMSTEERQKLLFDLERGPGPEANA